MNKGKRRTISRGAELFDVRNELRSFGQFVAIDERDELELSVICSVFFIEFSDQIVSRHGFPTHDSHDWKSDRAGISAIGAKHDFGTYELVGRFEIEFKIVGSPEPIRSIAVWLTQRELTRADENEGRRGLWLRMLDFAGLGFDS